ncbi:organic solute transporter Ostalpha-domain-containing protein [Xylariales sp. PMI_506]|nr:organic solute transporter Ostalpha-domain-containing protein [Xylariales sp. PMI_506]
MWGEHVCNSTLEDMRITTERKVAGHLTFHQLALLLSGVSLIIALTGSIHLMFRHAINYTKPREQKHIIRILFMVPVYSIAAFLSILLYQHAVYLKVISSCYEPFAISSFFALMCHYTGPNIHEQKAYFRQIIVKPWAPPLKWFAACCCGQRGPWRTPRSGLTWFNIIWFGVYNYCFIRVATTIIAAVTQHFKRYCESSNSPVFAHIWLTVIEVLAVFVAMVCLIQFYVQLRDPLYKNQPFLKILSIKLVIFLSFWQSIIISLSSSSQKVNHENEILAYPDVKVGIPNLLLSVEMAIFSIIHAWAYPYAPYKQGAETTYYPVSERALDPTPCISEHMAPQGGFLGYKAFLDALNVWDIMKAFGRGVRWIFMGRKARHTDGSYQRTDINYETGYPLQSHDPLVDHKDVINQTYDLRS